LWSASILKRQVFMRLRRPRRNERLLCAKGLCGQVRAIAKCGLPGERIFESLEELEVTGIIPWFRKRIEAKRHNRIFVSYG
jgi:hypothetical protein